MYGVLTPCGDCGGAHYDCGARDPNVCPDCDSTFVEIVDEDGTPQGLACPLCHLGGGAAGPGWAAGGRVRSGEDYDFTPPLFTEEDIPW